MSLSHASLTRISLPLLTLFMSVSTISAQTTISGTLVDQGTNIPEPYATIRLYQGSETTGTPENATVSDNNGNFEITAKKRGPYTILINSLGRTEIQQNVTIARQKKISLDTLYVTDDTQQIDAINVTAQKPLVKLETDKLTYSLEDDPDSKTQSVLDMLRRVPMVEVDAEENITVNGESSFKVYVDGRPNMMLTSNPSVGFRAMPANTVKSIEVITNPGAMYDSEGTSGVLSLTTYAGANGEKASTDGYTGNINLGVSTDAVQGGFYVGMQRGKHSLTLNGHGRYKYRGECSSVTLKNQDNGICQRTDYESDKDKHNFVWVNANYTLDIDSISSLDVMISFMRFKREGNGENQTLTTLQSDTLALYHSHSIDESKHPEPNGSISYLRYLSPEKDSRMTLTYQFSNNGEGNKTGNTYYDTYTSADYSLDLTSRRNEEDANSITHAAMADFKLALGRRDTTSHQKPLTLSTGLKYNGLRSSSDNDYYIIDEYNNATLSDEESDYFEYKYDVAALYAQLEAQIKKWKFRAGVRYEHTFQTIDNEHSFSIDYGNATPNAMASYAITDRQNIGVSYGMRIKRPSVSQLDPYVDQTDPTARDYGNSDLDAEKRQRVELTYNLMGKKAMLNFSVRYNYCDNTISDYSFYDEDGILNSTCGNIVTQNRLSFRFFTNINITPKTRLSIHGDVGYKDLSSDILGQSNSGWEIGGSVNLQQQLPNEFNLSLFHDVHRNRINIQSEEDRSNFSWIGLSRAFLKDKKLNVSVSGACGWNKDMNIKRHTVTVGDGFTTDDTFYFSVKRVDLRLTYNFGNGKFKERKKNKSSNDFGDDDSDGGMDRTQM